MKEIELKEHKFTIREDTNDEYILNEAMNSPLYEKSLNNPKVIIDIGCHIGGFLVKNQLKYPDALLYGYELIYNNYKLACKNATKASIYNLGVVGNYKPINICWDKINTGSYKYIYTENIKEVPNEPDYEIVDNDMEFIHINDVLNLHNKIDMLKIDTEGSEYNIIQSISDENYNKIQCMCVEFHNLVIRKYGIKMKYNNTREIRRLMNQKGFEEDYYKMYPRCEHIRFIKND